ncbi:uncharacterized protein LOC126903995 [Daktulosphaira vitifoliae]|uniref:uncharacterized protein LOC126903995 n=1 Tax=Daktulosphaira vitifoliae TaxID=58002 RepID=UPI0021AA45E3|nr:uncharacterized protein LOC126903995 [Daktulosphaira vitifoliae]XP_050538569.1 uncharacterized protein LOC126903995 [Daktulosphaira vitifoliae]
MENSLLEAIKSGNMGCHSELTIIPISQSSKSNNPYAVSSTSPQSTVSLSLVPNSSSGKSKNKHSLPSNSHGTTPRKRGKTSLPNMNHMPYDMSNYNPLLDLTMNRKHYANYTPQPEQQWPFNLPLNYPEFLMNLNQANKRKPYAYEQPKEKNVVNFNKENSHNKIKNYKNEHMPPPPQATSDRITGQLENVERTFDIDSLSCEDGWAKYKELLSVIEEMSGSIRPIYTGCKNSTERLKKSIHKAKTLVSECLKEVEKVSRQL